MLCSRFSWSLCLCLGQYHTPLFTIALSYVLVFTRNQLFFRCLSSTRYLMDKTESYLSLNVKDLLPSLH